MLARLKRIGSLLRRLEEALLVALMALMVFLALLPIFSRNLIAVGLVWVDPLLRHLVLWVTLLGASVAAREKKHLRIDFLPHYFPPRIQAWIKAGVDLFSAAVCLVLILPAVRFIQEEYEVGKELVWGVPVWASQLIIPFCLAVLAVRFLVQGWEAFSRGKA